MVALAKVVIQPLQLAPIYNHQARDQDQHDQSYATALHR